MLRAAAGTAWVAPTVLAIGVSSASADPASGEAVRGVKRGRSEPDQVRGTKVEALPSTGSDITAGLVGGGALVATGGALVVAARRSGLGSLLSASRGLE